MKSIIRNITSKAWVLIGLGSVLILSDCTNHSQPEVFVYGELRKIMHGGAREGVVSLTEILDGIHVYGIGAMENLDGEIIIFDNKLIITQAEPGVDPTIQTAVSKDAMALLLVTAAVESWQKIPVKEKADSKSIDAIIREKAEASGLDSQMPFPFIIEGVIEEVNWHIISSPEPGGAHDDHLEQSWKRSDQDIRGKILGFYSEHHQSIFTHHTTFIHMHILYENENLSGHVDTVNIRKGWTLSLPAG